MDPPSSPNFVPVTEDNFYCAQSYLVSCRQIVHREMDQLFEAPYSIKHSVLTRLDYLIGMLASELRTGEDTRDRVLAAGHALVDVDWSVYMETIGCETDRVRLQNYLIAVLDCVTRKANEDCDTREGDAYPISEARGALRVLDTRDRPPRRCAPCIDETDSDEADEADELDERKAKTLRKNLGDVFEFGEEDEWLHSEVARWAMKYLMPGEWRDLKRPKKLLMQLGAEPCRKLGNCGPEVVSLRAHRPKRNLQAYMNIRLKHGALKRLKEHPTAWSHKTCAAWAPVPAAPLHVNTPIVIAE